MQLLSSLYYIYSTSFFLMRDDLTLLTKRASISRKNSKNINE